MCCQVCGKQDDLISIDHGPEMCASCNERVYRIMSQNIYGLTLADAIAQAQADPRAGACDREP